MQCWVEKLVALCLKHFLHFEVHLKHPARSLPTSRPKHQSQQPPAISKIQQQSEEFALANFPQNALMVFPQLPRFFLGVSSSDLARTGGLACLSEDLAANP